MGQLEDTRDGLMGDEIADLLAHDRRTGDYDLAVRVRGGVAHLSGDVDSDEARSLVRRLAARVRGVNAVWDVLRLPGEAAPRTLDIGCARTKQQPFAFGVDRQRTPAVDVVADFERGLPFAASSIDQIYAVHVLEHIVALIPLMTEIHRVLKPTGVLHVMVPNWQFVNAVADPTHVRFFAAQTFKVFCTPTYAPCVFAPVAVATQPDSIFADLRPVKDGPPPTGADLARWFD